jgi:hypothetical protein
LTGKRQSWGCEDLHIHYSVLLSNRRIWAERAWSHRSFHNFHHLKVLCFGSATILLSSAYCFQLEEYIVVCVEERERVLQVHI